MAVTLSGLFGAFKAQSMNQKALLGSMDAWAGRTVNRAVQRGAMTNRAIRASMATRGMGGTFGLLRPGMQSSAMRGAMWGAGLGAAGSVAGDAMNNNLNFGSVGRAIGGGFRGGLMGGAVGGAMGALRPSMSTMGALNRGSARMAGRARTRAMRRNAAFEMGLR